MTIKKKKIYIRKIRNKNIYKIQVNSKIKKYLYCKNINNMNPLQIRVIKQHLRMIVKIYHRKINYSTLILILMNKIEKIMSIQK